MSIGQVLLLAAAAVEEEASMTKALLNTVMGIVIVFAALLLIAWIISLFKFINKLSDRSKKIEKTSETIQSMDESADLIEEQEAEYEADDSELVSVITAAIVAFEAEQGNEVPADGLFVRSIRKINKRRAAW